MSEPKVLIQVVLSGDNTVSVTLGTKHEALLALALRKASLAVDNVLLENEMVKEASGIVIPKSTLDRIA